jgi:ferredoxin
MEIGRLQGSTVVNYDNGLCISAKPGENYGFLARKCNVDIDYECRSGTCQTCMKILEFPNKRKVMEGTLPQFGGAVDNDDGSAHDIHRRSIFHCVGKMPRGYDWLHVLS